MRRRSADVAAGNVLLVPDDYPTIQAAIDAAQPGATVRVHGGNNVGLFAENLSITKAITLSGGWNSTFTEQDPGSTVVDGQSAGRVISITLAGAELVTIEGFTLINGDATGLGGLDEGLTAGEYMNPGFITPTVGLQGGAASGDAPAAFRSALAQWSAAGQLPDGVGAPAVMPQQLARWDALAAQFGGQAHRNVADDPAPDCGGAVYSNNAGFWLHDNTIVENVASREGDGFGGGVCVVNAPRTW